ncbi:spectrin beta chain, non-erythrocytic 4-like [Coturnix japonica]|uniref:spectrin beta chain, non-erythrocytic 4-like n=1 Tax=Coturnix japonica TaxID=93934 RepID=UPI0013A5D420|nr:spectrin beta chain, non-erythrocytic 4-like [Coturnix japonica]
MAPIVPYGPIVANGSHYTQWRCSLSPPADERESVQMKTFVKWLNSHLAQIDCHVTDLYRDLRDGVILTRLLGLLSGETMPRPTRGRMRIHSLETVINGSQWGFGVLIGFDLGSL